MRDWASTDDFIDFLVNKKGFKKVLQEESGIVHLSRDPGSLLWPDAISLFLGSDRVFKETIDYYLKKADIPLDEFWGDFPAK